MVKRMPRRNKNRPRPVRNRDLSNADRERLRQENEVHGGWYAAMRWRREQAEQNKINGGNNHEGH